MISLLVSAALVASAMASAAPSPAKPPPFAVRPGPGGGLVTAPDFPVEGRSALVAALRRGEPNLMLEAPDHILHVPSGVRLPRVLEGCRLGLVLPITPKGEKAASYQHGATAEYDCSPSDGLTQVEVSFETGFAPLKRGDRAANLMQIADAFTQDAVKVDRTNCTTAALTSHPLHKGTLRTQCGIRWADPQDPEQRTYGAATLVAGKGATFIRFTRRCVNLQCDASLAPFGRFFEAFDLRSLKE